MIPKTRCSLRTCFMHVQSMFAAYICMILTSLQTCLCDQCDRTAIQGRITLKTVSRHSLVRCISGATTPFKFMQKRRNGERKCGKFFCLFCFSLCSNREVRREITPRQGLYKKAFKNGDVQRLQRTNKRFTSYCSEQKKKKENRPKKFTRMYNRQCHVSTSGSDFFHSQHPFLHHICDKLLCVLGAFSQINIFFSFLIVTGRGVASSYASHLRVNRSRVSLSANVSISSAAER